MPKIIIPIVLALFMAGLAWSAEALSGNRIKSDAPWLCYYGDDRRVLDVEGYDLLLVESEAIGEITPEEKKDGQSLPI